MSAVETLEQIHNQAEHDLIKVTSREYGHLGSSLEENFGCIFGRDGAISTIFSLYTIDELTKTAETDGSFATDPLRHDPHGLLRHAQNTIRALARTQGRFFDPWRDEEPGKIIHEYREENEIPKNMTKLAELKAAGWPVDHGLRYYGSVDSTPLFLIASCKYLLQTTDWRFAEEIEDNIRQAVDWMRFYGDKDHDLFLEFFASNRHALLNQGWMDSGDSLKHQDGTRPKEPIALVEVQGYQYLALKLAAQFYKEMGTKKHEIFADELTQRAECLKVKFNRDFWMPSEGYFANALDGDKKQVVDIRSNVGHLLMTSIIADEKIPLVVQRLMQPDMLTKGGIRTLSSNSGNFSDQAPSGYHNGSIWPHDNAIIYLGLLNCGYLKEAQRVKDAVLGAEKQLGDRYGEYDMELYMVDRNGNPRLYETAQHPQGWVVNANLLWTAELDSTKLAA